MSIDEQGRQATEALRERRPPMEIPDPSGIGGIWHRRRAHRRMAAAAGAALLVTAVVVWQVQLPSSQSTPVKVGGPSATTVVPQTTVPPTTVFPDHPPTTLSAPAVIAGGKPFTFQNVTFQLPNDWQAFANGATAYLGWIGSSGPDLMFLRAQSGYAGAIEDVAPKTCVGRSDWNPPATTVAVAESGFRPVGAKTAQYRRWSVHCDAVTGPGNHNSPTPIDQQLRAWLLPVSHILIVEQVPPFNTSCPTCPIPDTTLTVVTNAVVH